MLLYFRSIAIKVLSCMDKNGLENFVYMDEWILTFEEPIERLEQISRAKLKWL